MEKQLKIEGMMCEHCVSHVKKALEGVQGVEKAEVKLDKKKGGFAKVKLSQEVDGEILKKAVEEAGYSVVGIS